MGFYIKRRIDDIVIQIPLYDDEIYTNCAECGKEIEVDTAFLADILQDGDLVSTAVFCEDCAKLRKQSGK